MGKVCTACGAAIAAPQKPGNESELCPHCAGGQHESETPSLDTGEKMPGDEQVVT